MWIYSNLGDSRIPSYEGLNYTNILESKCFDEKCIFVSDEYITVSCIYLIVLKMSNALFYVDRELIPWSWAFIEKLPVTQLLKNIPTVYGSQG
jgi:hypothetical protein